MSREIHDAVIIGAGPAGGTAARILARAGWSVAVVEKTAFPRRKVCGEFISATSLPLLYDDGVRDAYLGQAGPEVRRVGMFAGNSRLSSPMPSTADARGGWGRALGREHLDCILADAAVKAGAELWQPFKAVELRRDGALHVCTIAGENERKELTSRIVIMAKGSWEKSTLVPDHLAEAKKSDLLAFKAHFGESDLAPDLMPLLVFPGGYGGMVHSDSGRTSLSCCIRRDVLTRCRSERPGHAGDAVLDHIIKHCAGVGDVLERAVREGAWLSAGPIRPGMRRSSVDGVFFAGNMAGEAHPIIAEGISMAMQSAWLLCRTLLENQDRLSESRDMKELGRVYTQAWRAAFATRIRAAAAFAHLAMQPKAALAATLIGQFPGLLTWGAQLSGKAKQIVGQSESV